MIIIIMGIYFATEKSDVKKESVDNSEGICIEEEMVLILEVILILCIFRFIWNCGYADCANKEDIAISKK